MAIHSFPTTNDSYFSPTKQLFFSTLPESINIGIFHGSSCCSASVFDLQEVKDTKSKGVTLHLIRPQQISARNPGNPRNPRTENDLQHTS
jgi:hypothetical protein